MKIGKYDKNVEKAARKVAKKIFKDKGVQYKMKKIAKNSIMLDHMAMIFKEALYDELMHIYDYGKPSRQKHISSSYGFARALERESERMFGDHATFPGDDCYDSEDDAVTSEVSDTINVYDDLDDDDKLDYQLEHAADPTEEEFQEFFNTGVLASTVEIPSAFCPDLYSQLDAYKRSRFGYIKNADPYVLTKYNSDPEVQDALNALIYGNQWIITIGDLLWAFNHRKVIKVWENIDELGSEFTCAVSSFMDVNQVRVPDEYYPVDLISRAEKIPGMPAFNDDIIKFCNWYYKVSAQTDTAHMNQVRKRCAWILIRCDYDTIDKVSNLITDYDRFTSLRGIGPTMYRLMLQAYRQYYTIMATAEVDDTENQETETTEADTTETQDQSDSDCSD